jgi:hypothetical protein
MLQDPSTVSVMAEISGARPESPSAGES